MSNCSKKEAAYHKGRFTSNWTQLFTNTLGGKTLHLEIIQKKKTLAELSIRLHKKSSNSLRVTGKSSFKSTSRIYRSSLQSQVCHMPLKHVYYLHSLISLLYALIYYKEIRNLIGVKYLTL